MKDVLRVVVPLAIVVGGIVFGVLKLVEIISKTIN